MAYIKIDSSRDHQHSTINYQFSQILALLSLPVLLAAATVVGEVFRSLDATPFAAAPSSL